MKYTITTTPKPVIDQNTGLPKEDGFGIKYRVYVQDEEGQAYDFKHSFKKPRVAGDILEGTLVNGEYGYQYRPVQKPYTPGASKPATQSASPAKSYSAPHQGGEDRDRSFPCRMPRTSQSVLCVQVSILQIL